MLTPLIEAKSAQPYDIKIPNYKPQVSEIRLLAEKTGLTQNELGTACLTYALSTAIILRPTIEQIHTGFSDYLLEEIGGDQEYNRHRLIDLHAKKVAEDAIESIDRPVKAFIEENHDWRNYNQNKSGQEIVMIIDPLDGSTPLANKLRQQSAGAIAYDINTRDFAVSVPSLVDKRILVVEGNFETGDRNISFFEFDEETKSITPLSIDLSSKKDRELRVTALKRRYEPQVGKKTLSDTVLAPYLYSFGGYVLLEILSGNIDAMIDPFSGQIYEEAIPWGMASQVAGLWTTLPAGTLINWEAEIFNALDNDNDFMKTTRLPLLIANNRQTLNEIQAKLIPPPKSAPPFAI